MRDALLAITMSLLIANTSACGPAEHGRSIVVINECRVEVEFLIDGGVPPSSPEDRRVSRLPQGESDTYSVLVGDDQPAYIWLQQPPSEPVAIPAPSGAKEPRVLLTGEPCLASVEFA